MGFTDTSILRGYSRQPLCGSVSPSSDVPSPSGTVQCAVRKFLLCSLPCFAIGVTVTEDYANFDIIPVSPSVRPPIQRSNNKRERVVPSFLPFAMLVAKAIFALSLFGVHFCRAEIKKQSGDDSAEEEKSNR